MHFVIAAHPSESTKIGPKQKYAYPVTVIAKVPFGLFGDSDTQLGDLKEENRTWCYLVSFGPHAEFRVIPVWCLIEVKEGQRLWVVQHGSQTRDLAEYKEAVTGKRKRFRLPLEHGPSADGCPTGFVEGTDGEIVINWL